MVLGRAGLRLEAQKFVLYLLIPITASVAYNEPTLQRWSADYCQFMKYPSNPKTNLRQEFEQLQREREEELEEERTMEEKRRKGREEYLKQMKKLNMARSGGGSDGMVGDGAAADLDEKPSRAQGWFRWWGWNRREASSAM